MPNAIAHHQFDQADEDRWTPELVEARLIEAFETLDRVERRPGPAGFRSTWPAVMREWAELFDAQAYAEHQRAVTTVRLKPNMRQISRMEEALAWPARFLSADLKCADAINLWALAKARGISIAGILRYRNAGAVKQAKALEASINADLARQRAAQAQEVATWANMKRFLSDGSREHIERIEGNARIRLERCVANLRPVIIKPSDVSPDKVISQTSLDRHRYMASSLIVMGLTSH